MKHHTIEVHATPWRAMEFDGVLWNMMEGHETPLRAMKSHETPIIIIVGHVRLWRSIEHQLQLLRAMK